MAKDLAKILYVEDEDDIREVAQLALTAVGGFEVVACASGREAVARAAAAKADLVVIDVMMPDMDGFATLQALRRLPEAARVPVIFMTAKVQAAEVAQYRRLGAIGMIAKPFEPIDLPAEIRRIWGEASGDDAVPGRAGSPGAPFGR